MMSYVFCKHHFGSIFVPMDRHLSISGSMQKIRLANVCLSFVISFIIFSMLHRYFFHGLPLAVFPRTIPFKHKFYNLLLNAIWGRWYR